MCWRNSYGCPLGPEELDATSSIGPSEIAEMLAPHWDTI